MSDRVTLQFSTSTAWQSAIIRCMTHSPFSHIDIQLEDGTLLGASDSPNAPVIAGNPRGVAIRPANYEDFGLRVSATIVTEKADTIIAAAKSQLGKKFDNAALYGFLVDPLLPDDRVWMRRWVGSKLLAGFADRLMDDLIPPSHLTAFIGAPAVAKSWNDEGQWFCAEWGAWSFDVGGYWDPRKLGWPLARISPTDLLMMFALDPNFVNRDQFWTTLGNALKQGVGK